MNRVERGSRAPSRAAGGANRKLILWITIGVIIVAAIVAVALASRQPAPVAQPQKAPLKVGDKAPEFQLSTTSGPFDLAKADKPVFLEVFATWCPHCQRETAVIDSLYSRFSSRVDFVAVNGSPLAIDDATPESQADVVAFGQHFNVKYPLAYDPDLTVAKSYLQNGFPTLVIIGRDKTVKALLDGEIDEKTLADKIKNVL